MIGCFMQVHCAFVVGVGVLPADLGLGDFATPKCSAGGVSNGHFFTGFNFCEDIIGDGIVAFFQGCFCLNNPIATDVGACAFKDVFKIRNAYVGLEQCFVWIGDLGFEYGNAGTKAEFFRLVSRF